MKEERDYYRASEAAKIAGKSTRTILNWINEGVLSAYKKEAFNPKGFWAIPKTEENIDFLKNHNRVSGRKSKKETSD